MKRSIILSITLAALSMGVVSAQTPLTLSEYRKMVVDYSNQIKISRENSEAADQKVRKVRTGYYPSLAASATSNYLTNVPVSFPGLTLKNYSWTSQLTLQQNVYTGSAIRHQTEAAKIEYSIAELGEHLTLENVLYSADMIYWGFSAAEQQYEITQQYVEIVKHLYDIVNTRFTDGYISRTDQLMVETRLNEAQMQNIAAAKLYQTSLQQLNTLMGITTTQSYVAADSISSQAIIPTRVSTERALELRPDHLIALKKVELAVRNVRLSRTPYNPKFIVGFQGVYGTSSPNFTGDSKLYGVALGSLNIPIFNWNERRHSVSMARASQRSSQWSAAESANQVNGDLAIALADMQHGVKHVELAGRNLKVSLDNLELNTFSYSEGKLPILDVLSAQLAWIQSYTSYVTSNYNLKVAIAEYQKAAGVMGK